MSTNSNIDSVTNQGLFHPKVPRSEPLTTHGHAPGVLVGNDAIPESNVQILPAGSAPQERTFKPNPDFSGTGKVGGDGNDQEFAEDARTSAADTLGGANSAELSHSLGEPTGPQSSHELHTDGTNTYPGKRDRMGLVGVGATPGRDDFKEGRA